MRDTDPDSFAINGIGFQQNPPDIFELDWDQIKVDLHNELSQRGLVTWEDVQLKQNGVTAAILSALRRRVVMLYKQQGGKQNG